MMARHGHDRRNQAAVPHDERTAQLYLAANPEGQVTIDPDFDGLACEVFFEMD
jgi:hypothetical protein